MNGDFALELPHPSGAAHPFTVVMTEEAWLGTLRDQHVPLDGGGSGQFLFLNVGQFLDEVALLVAPPEPPEQMPVRVEVRESGAGFSVGMVAYVALSSGMEAVLNSCMDGSSSAGMMLLTKLSERSHLPLLMVHPSTGLLIAQESFPIRSELKQSARDALEAIGDTPVEMTYKQRIRAFAEMQRLFSEGDELSASELRVQGETIGRNDPCPCDSGKKFKKCCGGAS